MKNIKNTFLVSALSLGLIVGAVGIAGAATSADYQQKFGEWINPNPMVMNTISDPAPAPAPVPVVAVATPAPAPVPVVAVATPAPAPVVAAPAPVVAAPAPAPVSKAVAVPAAPQPNQYHYNDGHSGMNPQQHQQMHNNVNGNGHDNYASHNSMGENHMGSQSGHE